MKFLNFGTKLNITPQLENLYTSLPFVVGVTKVFTCSTSVMKNVRLPLLSSWELADKVSWVTLLITYMKQESLFLKVWNCIQVLRLVNRSILSSVMLNCL